MEHYLRVHGVRQSAATFAQPLRHEIWSNAERLVAEHGIAVQFTVLTSNARKPTA